MAPTKKGKKAKDDKLESAKRLILDTSRKSALAVAKLGVKLFQWFYDGDHELLRSRDPGKHTSIQRLCQDPEIQSEGYSVDSIRRSIYSGILYEHLRTKVPTLFPDGFTALGITNAWKIPMRCRDSGQWGRLVRDALRSPTTKKRMTTRELDEHIWRLFPDERLIVSPLPLPDSASGEFTIADIAYDSIIGFAVYADGRPPAFYFNCKAQEGLRILAEQGIIADQIQMDPPYEGQHGARMFALSEDDVQSDLAEIIELAAEVLGDTKNIAVWQEKDTDFAVRKHLADHPAFGTPRSFLLDLGVIRNPGQAKKLLGIVPGSVNGPDTLTFASKSSTTCLRELNAEWIAKALPDLDVTVTPTGRVGHVILAKNPSEFRARSPWQHPSRKHVQQIGLDMALGNRNNGLYVECYGGLAPGMLVALQWGIPYIGFEMNSVFFSEARSRVTNLVNELMTGTVHPTGKSDRIGAGIESAGAVIYSGSFRDRLEEMYAAGQRAKPAFSRGLIEGLLAPAIADHMDGGMQAVAQEFKKLLRDVPDALQQELLEVLVNERAFDETGLEKFRDLILFLLGETDEIQTEHALKAKGQKFFDVLDDFLLELQMFHQEFNSREDQIAGGDSSVPDDHDLPEDEF